MENSHGREIHYHLARAYELHRWLPSFLWTIRWLGRPPSGSLSTYQLSAPSYTLIRAHSIALISSHSRLSRTRSRSPARPPATRHQRPRQPLPRQRSTPHHPKTRRTPSPQRRRSPQRDRTRHHHGRHRGSMNLRSAPDIVNRLPFDLGGLKDPARPQDARRPATPPTQSLEENWGKWLLQSPRRHIELPPFHHRHLRTK